MTHAVRLLKTTLIAGDFRYCASILYITLRIEWKLGTALIYGFLDFSKPSAPLVLFRTWFLRCINIIVELAPLRIMFCLRSWIPLLFLLSNAPPIYLVLFLSANYFLHRPCVYCSLLLAILILALFDFQSNWFEPPQSARNGQGNEDTTPLQQALFDATTFVVGSVDKMAASIVDSLGLLGGINRPSTQSGLFGLADWLKDRREIRIRCLNAVIRL